MPGIVKIEEVSLKEVDLTQFSAKTLEHGFPVDPPRFVYHLAAFSIFGTWFIHPKRFETALAAAELQGQTMEARTIDPEVWIPLIEFNTNLHNGESYTDFVDRIKCDNL
jgi:hypothetical protein